MSLGYSEALFWSLTPRQIQSHFTAASRRLAREHNERMVQAFWTAALPNMKHPPKLRDLMIDEDGPRPRRKLSPEQIKAALIMALGPGRKDADHAR